MKLQAYGFCVLRRPILSKDVLESFRERTSLNPDLFESELRRIFSDPILLGGLQLATGSLYEATAAWLERGSVSGQEKLLMSLYKFLIRAASRCTPFGLFAGYLTIESDDKTQIIFDKQNQLHRFNRLDISVLEKIKLHILQNNSLRSHLLFYPSTSLYKAGENYRYIKRLDGALFIQSEVRAYPELERLLSQAKKGLTPQQLSTVLQRENLSTKGADAYVKALINSQILVSKIELNVTGEDYMTRLIKLLGAVKGTKKLTDKIRAIQKKLDQNAPAAEINSFVTALLKQEHPLEKTLQTTLSFPVQTAGISSKFLSNLGVQLSRISALVTRVASEDLQDFTHRFADHYGQQSIPLLLALDYDYGIGYGALSSENQPALPLLDGIDPNSPKKTRYQKTNTLADRLYQLASPKGIKRVMLTDSLLQARGNQNDLQMPHNFYVLGSVHTSSQEALDQGEFLFELKGISGPSATNLLTRFCVNDPVMTQHVAQVIRSEEIQDENVIHAEIAHLPSGKAGNIVQRPDLRSFEIAYLTTSTKEPKKSINPADLFLSCPDGKNLFLTSPKLDKRIIPVLSTAHNFGTGLPVYRFLGDLASQNALSLIWDWGKYENAPFLPRIQYEKLVISKASWLLGSEYEITPGQSRLDWWQDIKLRLNTPRFFTAGKGDQTLLFDSEHVHSLTLLAQMLKKEGSLRITESLENTSEGLINADGKHYVNELVIPFQNMENIKNYDRLLPPLAYNNAKKITRHFTTGTSWLYLKIYCAERLSDSLLTTTLYPLLASLENRHIIKKWFFIRYQDPAPHIRLRFFGNSNDFWAIIFKELHLLLEPLLENGMVQSLQSGRYQRELERFEPRAYAQIESFFHYDSLAVANCLKALPLDETLRWQGALLGTDLMLDDMGLDQKAKSDLIQRIHHQFSEELDNDGLIRRQMDLNYRIQKQQIILILGNKKPPVIQKLSNFFAKRSKQLKRLKDHQAMQDSSVQSRLAADLIHLFLNRWFYNHHRQQEFAVYHYLKKYYTSLMKNKNPY